MIYLGLLADQVFGKIKLISYDNDTAKVEIALVLQKIEVLGPITFEGCSSSQKTQNSIGFLRLITFVGCNSP